MLSRLIELNWNVEWYPHRNVFNSKLIHVVEYYWNNNEIISD